MDCFWKDASYGVDVGGVSVSCYDEGGSLGYAFLVFSRKEVMVTVFS